jgi:DNA-damage-inducible protein J
MAQVNIRIDDDLKNRADALFEELGLNMTTAFNMFVRQTVRQGGIPFEITTKADAFYSESNMRVLRASIADMDAGRGIVRKSLEDLETMEDA